jgi:hypothetical protein
MKCHSARGASLAIVLAVMTSTAVCQDTGHHPSLLPLPPLPRVPAGYTVSRAAATDSLWGQEQISPVQTSPAQTSPAQISPLQKDHSVINPDYGAAMKGGYESCTTPAGGGMNCCSNHYVYANALVMSALKPGGYVTSIDDVTFDQRLNYCNREFGNIWRGGFEIGAGWCFGGGCGGCGECGSGGCGGCCNTNAIEFVYWGLFPGTTTITAVDDMNSMIDFSGLDYNGANAQVPYTSAECQQVSGEWNFNSVEINLVGNSWNGGPFGCAMCGCCYGRGGSPWGFGYVTGFRYMNFSDRFLFSSDPVGFEIDGEADELNYSIACNNNLFGYQLGAGLSYCVCDSFSAYAIAKTGIYGNSVTAYQTVYGTAGTATINNGPYTGEDFSVRTAAKMTLATCGQLDIGGRWSVTNHWTINGGYRVLGLAGVSTVDVNLQKANFHDVDGIAAVQRTGSFLLHGAYMGAAYCW